MAKDKIKMALSIHCLLLIFITVWCQEARPAPRIVCLEVITNRSYSCEGLGLRGLPDSIPSTTEKLDLSFNFLFSLYHSTFRRLERLVHLDLTRCHINLIYEEVFKHNIHLHTLLLVGNPILYIADTAFDGPIALKHLFLEQISLTNMSFIPMKNLQSLQTLSLGNNFILSIQFPINFPTENLRVLDFQSNFIKKIYAQDVEVLKHTNNLSLVLKGNDIDYIEPGSFRSINLYNLDLKGNSNPLSIILQGLIGLTTNILGIGKFYDTQSSFRILPSTLDGLCNITVQEVNIQYREFLSPSNATFSCLTKIQKLDITETHLSFLPLLNSPVPLSHLIISQNIFTNICDINPSDFPFLTSLQLRSNMKTMALGDGCLKSLTRLEYLDLSHNDVGFITCCRTQLSGLSSLKYLNFSHNAELTLPDTAFTENGLLEMIDFSSTRITFNGSLGPFNNLKLLRFLNLSNSHINGSNENLLMGLKNLLSLNMRKSSFHMGIIQNNNLFIQSLNLEVLILSWCDLSAIEELAFAKLEKLNYIDLSHNKLITFSSNAFSDLSHIHILFSFNAISDIPLNLVKGISGTSIIDVSHNPLDCSCSNIQFLLWYQDKEKLFEEKQNTLCGSPKTSENIQLSAIHIYCGLSPSVIFVVVLGVILVVPCIILAARIYRKRIYFSI